MIQAYIGSQCFGQMLYKGVPFKETKFVTIYGFVHLLADRVAGNISVKLHRSKILKTTDKYYHKVKKAYEILLIV